MPPEPTDGRLRKGAARRRALLDATLRLVGRDGVAGVTQRAVATEADVPPSAVLYYFDSVDALLVSALREVNEQYCVELGAVRSVADLVAHLVRYAGLDRDLVVAEYELCLLAARRADLRPELEEWDRVVDAVATRLSPTRSALVAAALNGLYLRAATTGLDRDEAHAVLTAAVG